MSKKEKEIENINENQDIENTNEKVEDIEQNASVKNVTTAVKVKKNKYANIQSAELATTEDINNMNHDLEVGLKPGNLPSGKYLKQEILSPGPINDSYVEFMKSIGLHIDVVPIGKGKEYILTQKGTVNSADLTQYIPNHVTKMSNFSHVDTIDLPDINTQGKNPLLCKIEKNINYLEILPFFISGKGEEFIAELKANITDTMNSHIFMKLYTNVLLPMYQHITSKTPTMDLNNIVSNYIKTDSDSLPDAVCDLLNAAKYMLYDNTKFNYGYEENGEFKDFTSAYNKVKQFTDLVFITDIVTYGNIKKYAPFVFNSGEFKQFSNIAQFVVLPPTIADVTNPNGNSNDLPVMLDLNFFYDKNGNYKKGSVLVIGKNSGIVGAKNLHKATTSFYGQNNVNSLVYLENYTLKALKWTQCMVFENPALQEKFVIPTITGK